MSAVARGRRTRRGHQAHASRRSSTTDRGRVASRRRARWLAKRERRGQTRPRPAVVVAGNAMSVSTGPDHAGRIFTRYLSEAFLDRAAVAAGVTECADFRADALVRAFNAEHGTHLRAYQFGAKGSPESGSVLVVDLARVTPHGPADLIVGSKPSGEGRGVRARSMVSLHATIDSATPWAWSVPLTAGHAAPSWAPRARGQFIRKLRTLRGIRLGDMNLVRRALARLLPGVTVRVAGVIAAMVPGWISCSTGRKIPRHQLAGADHDGIAVTLWP